MALTECVKSEATTTISHNANVLTNTKVPSFYDD